MSAWTWPTWNDTVCLTAAAAAAVTPSVQLIPLDIEPYMAEFAAPFFEKAGLANRIKPMIGPADESMVKLGQEGRR